MDKSNDELLRQRSREKTVLRYTSALERGDFETVVAILAQMESDTELEGMIVEVNEALESEQEAAAVARDAARVQRLLHEHVPSGFAPSDEDVELPPLTVAAVVARISEDAAQRGQITPELARLVRQLAAETSPVPEQLSLGAVRQLLSRLGISASASAAKLFRATAIYLAEGREQGHAYQAAARRQRQMHRPPSAAQPPQSEAHRSQEDCT